MRVPLLILISLLIGCRKEEATLSKFILSNQSGVSVKIVPTTTAKDTIVIKNAETIEYDQGWERGLGTGINFAFFADGNPVTVIFDEKHKITHYRDTLSHTGKSYNLTSKRNFYHNASYTKDITSTTKYIRDVDLIYTFTEQDYLDAKQ